MDVTPKGFSSFSREWGELLFQTKILAVGHVLEASVHEKIFQIGPTVLALKLDKGGMPPLSYFSNNEDGIQSQQNLVWDRIVSRYIIKKLMTVQSKTTSQ